MGQEHKHRIKKMESVFRPFEAKKPRRTWIVSGHGKDEKEAAAAIEARIAEIKTGEIKHPRDGQPFEDGDKFMELKVIDIEGRKAPKFDIEKALYETPDRKAPDPGDNGGPPAPVDEDEEIEALERQIETLTKALEDDNGDS